MGTGIFLTMYSQTASILYFSCADMGITGAPSAIVPVTMRKQCVIMNLRTSPPLTSHINTRPLQHMLNYAVVLSYIFHGNFKAYPFMTMTFSQAYMSMLI